MTYRVPVRNLTPNERAVAMLLLGAYNALHHEGLGFEDLWKLKPYQKGRLEIIGIAFLSSPKERPKATSPNKDRALCRAATRLLQFQPNPESQEVLSGAPSLGAEA